MFKLQKCLLVLSLSVREGFGLQLQAQAAPAVSPIGAGLNNSEEPEIPVRVRRAESAPEANDIERLENRRTATKRPASIHSDQRKKAPFGAVPVEVAARICKSFRKPLSKAIYSQPTTIPTQSQLFPLQQWIQNRRNLMKIE